MNKNSSLSYSIGQVAKFADLPQSVLRYWETVFEMLDPKKSAGGSRQYNDADVKLILCIKELLYENGFTIKGANAQLRTEHAGPATESAQNYSSKPNSKNLNPASPADTAQIIQKLKELILLLED